MPAVTDMRFGIWCSARGFGGAGQPARSGGADPIGSLLAWPDGGAVVASAAMVAPRSGSTQSMFAPRSGRGAVGMKGPHGRVGRAYVTRAREGSPMLALR